VGTSKFAALKQVRQERDEDPVQPEAPTIPSNQEQTVPKDQSVKVDPIASVERPLIEERRRGRPPGKRSHEAYTQITAYIRKETQQEVKLALLQRRDGRDVSELIEELLTHWLESST
jgi:hypothetical protein